MIKIHFHVVPPLGPFWSVKYLNFLEKATNSDGPSHFTKNLYYVLSTCRSQTPILKAHTLRMTLFILGLSRVTFYNAIVKTEQ